MSAPPVSATVPPLPASFSAADLKATGFVGWRTWNELRGNGFAAVPRTPAVYVLFRAEATKPAFLAKSPGGRFKGRDPTVSVSTLAEKWVPGAHIVYIGKAKVANRRLKQFARFGAGEPVGHWGGRLIWQLVDVASVLVAWHSITWSETAREYEKRLIAHFEEIHGGSMPFANLTH
jgi:hypothetical protein